MYSVHINETDLGKQWDEYGFSSLEDAMDYVNDATSAYAIVDIYEDLEGHLAVHYAVGD